MYVAHHLESCYLFQLIDFIFLTSFSCCLKTFPVDKHLDNLPCSNEVALCSQQVSPKNILKDFVHVAGPLGVTHLLMFTQTEMATYLVSTMK